MKWVEVGGTVIWRIKYPVVVVVVVVASAAMGDLPDSIYSTAV